MLDDAQRKERDALRALVFGPPSQHPATPEQRARLDVLEQAAEPSVARLPSGREADADVQTMRDSSQTSIAAPDLSQVSTVAPAAIQVPPASFAARDRRGGRMLATAGVLLAAVAFVCGLALGPDLDPSVVAASTGATEDVDTVRSFARVSTSIAWDQPSLLGVAKYGDDVTAWTGRVADGALSCAAFDDGTQVVVKCLRISVNPLPHSFTWTKADGPDTGEYTVRVGRGGDVEGWFESARSSLR